MVNLYNLAQRIVINKRLLKNNPEQKELLERKIKETEKYILELVEKNSENEILKKIFLD